MSPVKIAAALLALASVGAVVQTVTAVRPGKKLALASVRYSLEERARTDRDGVMREALAARERLRKSTDLDVVFRDVATVWVAREPSADLSRPTVAELESLPTAEALEAVRRLTPDTGFEGARIRSLYEARRSTPREQQPVLARLIGANPADASAIRAYTAALRRGTPEERRKAIELARDYVSKDGRSRLSRLTLVLALYDSVEKAEDPKLRAEAAALAEELAREVPKDSSSARAVADLAASLRPKR